MGVIAIGHELRNNCCSVRVTLVFVMTREFITALVM
jgi:hypothetical protein